MKRSLFNRNHRISRSLNKHCFEVRTCIISTFKWIKSLKKWPQWDFTLRIFKISLFIIQCSILKWKNPWKSSECRNIIPLECLYTFDNNQGLIIIGYINWHDPSIWDAWNSSITGLFWLFNEFSSKQLSGGLNHLYRYQSIDRWTCIGYWNNLSCNQCEFHHAKLTARNA